MVHQQKCIAVNFASLKGGRAPSPSIFPDDPIFQNQKIVEIFSQNLILSEFFLGNLGIFRPDFLKPVNFAIPFFQNRNIFSQEIGKLLEMREIQEKMLEM